MGKTLNQKSTGSKGAVVSLARRVHHTLRNKGAEYNLICDVWNNKAWAEFTSRDILKSVRTAAKNLKLQERGIGPNMIGVQSLQ